MLKFLTNIWNTIKSFFNKIKSFKLTKQNYYIFVLIGLYLAFFIIVAITQGFWMALAATTTTGLIIFGVHKLLHFLESRLPDEKAPTTSKKGKRK